MPLSVAIQMDPIEHINFEGDSTLILALEAQRRGHTLFYYQPRELVLRDGVLYAWVRPITLRYERGNHFTLGQEERVRLSDMDVVLLRQDPPFDMHYITTTYHLERIHPKTLVVNNPREVRNCPEKLFICDFPELMPPTLITEDIREIEDFRKTYKDIVIKPLYAFGGTDIFHITETDENFTPLLEMFKSVYQHPMIIQQYLPKVKEGDKRLIFINGEIAGALNRIPAEGHIRSNLRVGGKAVKTALTDREREIAGILGPELKLRGLILAGVDVIGGYITEINVTSPTGLQAVNRLDNVKLEIQFWDAVEATVADLDSVVTTSNQRL